MLTARLDPPLRTCTVDLTLDLIAPRAARSLLDLLLPQWAVTDPELRDGAAIVISELVTNALLHGSVGGGLITVGVELREGELRLWVVDPSPLIPRQRSAEPDAEHGRGLGIVDQIAARWGVEAWPVGKRVFAELPLTQTRCA